MVYDNIKRLCDEKNIPIMTVEKDAGLSNGTIGKWRTANPTVANLDKVAKVLEVTIDDLIKEPS